MEGAEACGAWKDKHIYSALCPVRVKQVKWLGSSSSLS